MTPESHIFESGLRRKPHPALVCLVFSLFFIILAAGCPTGPRIKFIPPGQKPTIEGLLTEFPRARVYVLHQEDIYKALLVVPFSQKFDSTGWIRVRKFERVRALAGDMQGYLGEHRAVWKAVTDPQGNNAAYLLTSVGGGFVRFRDGTLVLDFMHFMDEFHPTAVQDDGGPDR